MYADEIRTAVRGEVLTDEASLASASRDASIFEVQPEVVVAPNGVEDVKALVKFVTKKRTMGDGHISLTARSAGTDMSGGPLNDSVILDFTRHFNHIRSVSGSAAVVEPGVFYRDLELELASRGLMLPSYPASKALCTVGGMVANNAGGEKTLAYGKTDAYVESLRAVFADSEEHLVKPLDRAGLERKRRLMTFEGQIYRKLHQLLEDNYSLLVRSRPNVSKNSAGYALWDAWDKKTFDLTKLITGSQGTLCLITEITFRLVPKKKYSRLAVIFLRDLAPLGRLIKEVLVFQPESFEAYDDHTVRFAVRFFPDMMHTIGGKVFTLAWQFLPEAVMVFCGGVPKLILLVELTSDDERELGQRLDALCRAVQNYGVSVRLTRSEREAEKYRAIRRESFNLLRRHVRGRTTAPFIDDVIVRPEVLTEFLPRLNAILEPHRGALIYTVAGHAGDGNFHVIPLMDLRNPKTRDLIPRIAEEVYDLVVSYGGSITAEHNDGLIRTPYLKRMYGKKVCDLFAEVKKTFDPLGIFNPRKKVGGDLDYTLRHIRKSE